MKKKKKNRDVKSTTEKNLRKYAICEFWKRILPCIRINAKFNGHNGFTRESRYQIIREKDIYKQEMAGSAPWEITYQLELSCHKSEVNKSHQC